MDNNLNYLKKLTLKSRLFFFMVLIIFILFLTLTLDNYLNFSTLKAHHALLIGWTQKHYLSAVFLFITSYTLAVAISIPGSLIFTLLGGLLFGGFAGTIYVVFSATLGATFLFITLQTTAGRWSGGKLFFNKLEVIREGFQKNAFTYLLILRLIPIFPFFLVNISAALLKVPLQIFIIATGIGIIPSSAIYVWLGSGLSYFFSQGKNPDLTIIFSLPILLPLIGLVLLCCLPLLYQRIK
ncbi:TVP38/TMEM64 family protein [Legionella sp. D16C41]|uniref:TVP38/TMEM64 family protein n=1 Tax=Legionella sp. D16C41 TaxID=3402688 RepID=UPI003AF5911D